MSQKTITVGTPPGAQPDRSLVEHNPAGAGNGAAREDAIAVLSWSALAAVMTDKRHELLRHLRRHPAQSVRALARDLGRDYKRVHDDVALLAKVGLVRRDGEVLRADYDEIRAVITM